MKKILIADDHEVTRRGVREILSEAFEGVEISEAANGSEVIERLPAHQWDLILLDVMMPNTNILTLLEAVRATHPTVPILVVTSATELEYVVQTMKRGPTA